MKTNILHRYAKSHWMSDDFGLGKSKQAKSRNKRVIKKRAKNRFGKDLNKE